MPTLGQNIDAVATSQLGNGNVYGSGPWCAFFATWVLQKAGYKDIGQVGGCSELKDWAMKHGTWHPAGDGYKPQEGDLALFNWHGGSSPEHVGITEADNGNGTLSTIEGNTSRNTSSGVVARKTRSVGNVVGYISIDGPSGPTPQGVDGYAGGRAAQQGMSGAAILHLLQGMMSSQTEQTNQMGEANKKSNEGQSSFLEKIKEASEKKAVKDDSDDDDNDDNDDMQVPQSTLPRMNSFANETKGALGSH